MKFLAVFANDSAFGQSDVRELDLALLARDALENAMALSITGTRLVASLPRDSWRPHELR